MNLNKNLVFFEEKLKNTSAKLIVVSKTNPIEILQEAYNLGCRIFGENRVQELVPKYEALPKDIDWHLIGTLQGNKVKYIAPFVKMIHSIDSFKLLAEVNKQALKCNRTIDCLLQIHIADEETKFGFSFEEAEEILKSDELANLQNIKIAGLMGMASNTDDSEKVRLEFRGLKTFFEKIKSIIQKPNINFQELSMGMSGDYPIALEEGSTLIRVGSAIFGERK